MAGYGFVCMPEKLHGDLLIKLYTLLNVVNFTVFVMDPK